MLKGTFLLIKKRLSKDRLSPASANSKCSVDCLLETVLCRKQLLCSEIRVDPVGNN